MKLLLDTNVFLWSTEESDQIARYGDAINDPANEFFISAATVWEIAIRQTIGKLRLTDHAVNWIVNDRERHGFRTLSILDRHIWTTLTLPLHHRDPFDRLILAQALSEDMTLLTSDLKMRLHNVSQMVVN